MIIEETRCKVHAGRVTIVVRGFERTFLMCITNTHAVRHVLETTRQRDIVVGVDTCAVDFVLPVGVGEQMLSRGIVVAKIGVFFRSLPPRIVTFET